MIEAENVHYSYPNKVEALKGVSITIKDGEFVAIMGQNGAGKSTFVKHFNGLLKPSVGRVRADGVETTKTSVATLPETSVLFFRTQTTNYSAKLLKKKLHLHSKILVLNQK